MNTTTSKPFDIRERAFQFALSSMALFARLQKHGNSALWVIGKQFLRAATSVGANLEEAQAAESKADFVHKNSIALKEARETHYWLRLIREANALPPEQVDPILNEARELALILGAIIQKAKTNHPHK